MKLSDYIRDPKKVKDALEQTDDGAVIAKKRCAIYCPLRFRDKALAVIGNEIYIIGVFMLVVDGKHYAINMVPAMMRIAPSNVNEIVFEDTDYFEFEFEPGDAVFANVNLIKNDKLLYYIFDEVIARGNVPAFMNYNDLGHLYDSAEKFTGVRLTSTPTIMHMLFSTVCRNPKDPKQYFRQVTNGKDLDQVRYVQMRGGTYGATNTTARLMGAYLGENLTSALINPSDREENIERILRN